MNQELLRIIDGIARDRNIDREVVLCDLEAAMVSAIRKAHGQSEDTVVTIDRQTGDIAAAVDGVPMSMRDLSRIAAQTAKQVMIQKFREAERGSIFDEYSDRKGQIVTGRTVRWEGGGMLVDLGRAEAILPKSEMIPGETYMADERIRAMVFDVRQQGGQVRIVLTRSHPEFIRRLFELEVPEVAERIIEIKALAREAGYRTKVAVYSLDAKVDPVGACVGMRGSRIKNIVEEVAGEKIDIVRWHDSSQTLIGHALKPAEVADIALCFELGRATVVVGEDQLSLAIGKRGQNVRLAARLTGWDVDILTPTEFNTGLDLLEKTLKDVPGVDRQLLDQIVAMGMISIADVDEVGPVPLEEELKISTEVAKAIVAACAAAGAAAGDKMTGAAKLMAAETGGDSIPAVDDKASNEGSIDVEAPTAEASGADTDTGEPQA